MEEAGNDVRELIAVGPRLAVLGASDSRRGRVCLRGEGGAANVGLMAGVCTPAKRDRGGARCVLPRRLTTARKTSNERTPPITPTLMLISVEIRVHRGTDLYIMPRNRSFIRSCDREISTAFLALEIRDSRSRMDLSRDE